MTDLGRFAPEPPPPVERELVLSTKEDWERFVRREPPARPEMLTRAAYAALDPPARTAWDRARSLYHSSGLVVVTPRMEKLYKEIKVLVSVNRGEIAARRGIIVSGPPSMGKTTAVAHWARSYQLLRERNEPDVASNPAFMPVVYFSVPEHSRSKMVAEAIANYVAWKYRSRDSASEITDGVVAAMRNCGTSLVIIDEIHWLSQTRNSVEVDNFLKRLANNVPATFIYLGIDVEGLDDETGPDDQTGLGNQTKGRFKVFHYDAYGEDDDEWAGVVSMLEAALALLDHRTGLLSRPLLRYLHARTTGRLGSLSALIREAALRAMVSGTEQVNLSVLEEVTLDLNAETAWANNPEMAQILKDAEQQEGEFVRWFDREQRSQRRKSK